MNDRLDAGAGSVGTGVEMGDQADDGSAPRRFGPGADGGGQRGHHVAVVVERRVREARLAQLARDEAAELELAG